MKYRQRAFYKAQQKLEMWDRWQHGESLSTIGRRFDRASSSIFPHLAKTGGIRPPDRARFHFALTLIEREEISPSLAANRSLRQARLRRYCFQSAGNQIEPKAEILGHGRDPPHPPNPAMMPD
jgi:hypothetical protein